MDRIRDRISELDALRGLAALAVMLFHYVYFYNHNYAIHPIDTSGSFFQYGAYGVHLFFIISGFVIYMTIRKCESVKDFWVKRAIRLYPAYLTAVAFTFLATSTYSGLDSLSISIIDALLNATMLQGVVPGVDIPLVDGSYWSLAVELHFYVFCGMLLATGLLRSPLTISWVWMVTIYVLKLLFVAGMIHPIVGDLGIVNYSNLFIAGVMFFELKNGKRIVPHVIIVLAAAYQFIFFSFLSGVIVSAFYLLFYALLTGNLRLLNNKPLIALGTISYSLYLIHQNVGYLILHYLEDRGFTQPGILAVPVVVSILLAVVITNFIERPLQRKMLRAYGAVRAKDGSDSIPVAT
ncbi:acyltransferase family protein [Paenibacillus antri]|uniref:acyltransferase family protein n=1 Tax=Paenibacillus antri TaxID=2582848 RepID=UPI0013051852|nr:acyltransferase [Paenibacillus antri]